MSGMRNSLKFATALVGGVLAGTTMAHASGFQLKEQGAGVQGLSFAGATAKADDLSTLFFNPAGMSRLDGDQAELNLSYIVPSAEFNPTSASGGVGGNVAISDGDGGDAGVAALVPSVYGMYQLDERTRIGLSVNTPFGLSTEYDDGWVGRYHALKSELTTIAVSPMISYQATDKLSVGFGPVAQYATGELTQAVNFAGVGGTDGLSKVEADDIGYGIQAGLLYEFDEDSRVGVSYRSQVRHRLEGNIKLFNVPGAVAGLPQFANEDGYLELTTPDIVSIGAYHALNDKWAVLGDLAWTNWSTFNEIRIVGDSGLERQYVRESWNDTFFVALGTEYKPTDEWTLQFGVAYDESPVDDEFRTFRIPDSDRFWMSAGVGYEINENFSANIAYTHIIADDVSVTQNENAGAFDGTVTGDYDASVDIVAVNLSYKF